MPANNGLSIRHTTRNFPNREGSKPGDGQLSGVVLMDARSIAATARNHGVLTSATEVDYVQPRQVHAHTLTARSMTAGSTSASARPEPEAELQFGPNIAEWPAMPALAENLLHAGGLPSLRDPVTTTDELIPSGETSSYRSNPMKLAVLRPVPPGPRLRAPCPEPPRRWRSARQRGSHDPRSCKTRCTRPGHGATWTALSRSAPCIFANKPGDGSAREQAASCQRVLGGCANICYEFATKRYRSNCVNWGMLPFTLAEGDGFPPAAPVTSSMCPDVEAKGDRRGDEELPRPAA